MAMTALTRAELEQSTCQPCNQGTTPLGGEEVRRQLEALPGWELVEDGRRIRKRWRVRDFLTGLAFFGAIAPLAETAGHHPDLTLENYRDVSVTMWTHSIGGLSINDFILAAKIDSLAQGLGIAAKENR